MINFFFTKRKPITLAKSKVRYRLLFYKTAKNENWWFIIADDPNSETLQSQGYIFHLTRFL